MSASFLLGVLGPSVLIGQTPRAGYFFPPAVPRGQATNVSIGGYDLTPDVQIFVLDPRIELRQTGPLGEFHITPPPYWFGPRQYSAALPIPREIPARLSIPKELFHRIASLAGGERQRRFSSGRVSRERDS